MSPASIARHHADWLQLVDVSGPFLTLPVLKRALPQGLNPTPLPSPPIDLSPNSGPSSAERS